MLAGRYHSGSNEPLVLLFISFGLLMGSCYIINQLADKEGDSLNQKLYFIADGHISWDAAVITAGFAALLGDIGLLFVDLQFALIGVLFFIIAGIMYNLHPFRLKDHPVFGPLVSIFGGGVAFTLGVLPYFDGIHLLMMIPYLLAIGAVSVLTTVPDMEGDRATAKQTLAVKIGPGRTSIAALIMCLGAVIMSWWLQDRILFWPALLSLPLFFYASVKLDRSSVILAIKFPIFILSLAVGFRFPVYLLLMAIYFVFARWYYSRRFKMEYPSFKLQ